MTSQQMRFTSICYPRNQEKRKKIKEITGDWPVHLDFTEEGELLGVEIMDASKVIDVDYLKKLSFRKI